MEFRGDIFLIVLVISSHKLHVLLRMLHFHRRRDGGILRDDGLMVLLGNMGHLKIRLRIEFMGWRSGLRMIEGLLLLHLNQVLVVLRWLGVLFIGH